MTQLPDNKQKSYLKNLPFVAQEWLRDASDNNGPVARSLIADFGDVHKVRQIIGAHFQCAVLAQQKVGDFEESVRVASDGQAVLGDSAESKKIWSALHLTDGLSIIASRSNGWLQRRFMSRHCNDYLVIPNSIAMPLPPGMPGPPPIWM